MTIREATEADAGAIAEIAAAADDTRVVSAAAVVHQLRSAPPRGRMLSLVAEEGGRVVGSAAAALDWWTDDPSEGWAHVDVLPAARRRGIGSALYEHAVAHTREVGARRLRTMLRESEAGLAFASARGWRPIRTEIVVGVDPRRVPEHPGVEGFETVPLAALAHRLEDVYALDQLAARDEPRSAPFSGQPYDEWLESEWRQPTGDLDAGTAVLRGDDIVALAFLQVDLARRRAANGFTATHPDFRGRGLALLAKTRSLRWAAERGIELVTTGNDERNAPMRAVNRRLGYEPVGRRFELELAP